VRLGDFETKKIDLDDGRHIVALTWSDLGLASGEQRKQIIDALRKYS
jgi:hypothetical protein